MKDHVRAEWSRVILVCGKCGRKNGGGFGPDGDARLGKLLAKRIGGGRKRKARVGVIETSCLGVCPKRATMVVDAARPDRWLIVESGTDVDVVVERLGLTAPS